MVCASVGFLFATGPSCELGEIAVAVFVNNGAAATTTEDARRGKDVPRGPFNGADCY